MDNARGNGTKTRGVRGLAPLVFPPALDAPALEVQREVRIDVERLAAAQRMADHSRMQHVADLVTIVEHVIAADRLARRGAEAVCRGMHGVEPAQSLLQAFRQRLEGMVTGTSKSHQRVSPPALRSLEALVGDEQVFAAFGEIVTSLMQKVLANRAESLTLAQTRDLLLPKLMSGEIRMGEAEPELEKIQ